MSISEVELARKKVAGRGGRGEKKRENNNEQKQRLSGAQTPKQIKNKIIKQINGNISSQPLGDVSQFCICITVLYRRLPEKEREREGSKQTI